MELNHLEALKQLIFRDIIFAPTPGPRMRLGRGGSRRRSKPTEGPTDGLHIALGAALTAHNGDYRLAIRIQDPTIGINDPRIQAMRTMARGEVDIAHIGYPRPQTAAGVPAIVRPLHIGDGIGCVHGSFGTIGLFPWSPDRQHRLILSNHHVIACARDAAVDAAVIAPGRRQLGGSSDVVGTYLRGVAPSPVRTNLFDIAVARLEKDVQVEARIRGIGCLTGLVKAQESVALVRKMGQGSGLTFGEVVSARVDHVTIPYPGLGEIIFDRVLEIHGTNGPFSRPGDSGALVVDGEGRGVGLIFAGNEERNESLAFDIVRVMEELGLPLDIA